MPSINAKTPRPLLSILGAKLFGTQVADVDRSSERLSASGNKGALLPASCACWEDPGEGGFLVAIQLVPPLHFVSL